MKLLNWREVSRTLTGGEEGIRPKKIPYCHEQAVKELTDYCKQWIIKHQTNERR